ncbi:hypothetical protein [Legionella oakridgensis]|uniref:Polysaccharide deacetylase n=2 Tax=Legionella oakridgensis TaxID=29423 RepID=W0BCL8_9GAMM|nr:hypothetical protein [Legionella oakridgensis]AHE67615.1 hypothetical protein Loa_02071 [Legionella oakridgensis ATCC 33761 = DSM 21215]ETO92853.1 hypothetical protein LOR_61c15070 [Legionella oakridgensis RV-2-2007]KTD37040.1 hypothetical protein Loak_2176 [Legionella oakridgensis]STY20651.1 Uncharacterised protein [Legionella longbeachae]
MDFTLSIYEHLLRKIQETQHATCTVRQFMSNQPASSAKKIVLRHDVDRRPKNALNMAKLEANLGIQSTYYFRHMPQTFKPKIILEIAAMGHEIGYHYETLAKAKGNSEKAYHIFKRELDNFRQLSEVNTICMHGRPLSPWDNRDLWKTYDYTSLGIIGEPYLSIDYKNILYLTDTGRRWDGEKYNLRDKVNQQERSESFSKTRDIINFLQHNQQTVILQTHPERWAYSPASFLISYGSDQLTNVVKRILKKIR